MMFKHQTCHFYSISLLQSLSDIMLRMVLLAFAIIVFIFAEAIHACAAESNDNAEGAAIIFHGNIGEVSKLPNPTTAPYKDCLFAAEFFPKENNFLKTIILFWGFENRKLVQSSAIIKTGISIRAEVIPFDRLPKEMQLVQQANDLNDFDSEVYFCRTFEPVESMGSVQRLFHRSAVNIISPPMDKHADTLRAARISKEKERINTLIAKNGGLELWRKNNPVNKIIEILKSDKENTRYSLYNGVLFSYHKSNLPRFNKRLPVANPVQGLSAMNQFLRRNNIHLILLMWPSPEEVAADLFFPEIVKIDQYLDVFRVQLMQEFLNNDIEVVDLLPLLREKRFRYPPLLFQAHLNDCHPASGANRIAAEELSDILKRFSFAAESDSYSLIEIPMRKGREYENKKEIAVSINGKTYNYYRGAELLFAGDSFAYHPQRASSVGAFCSYHLHKKADLHARSGGAPRLFRTLLQEHQTNGLLNGKKSVILSVLPSFDTRWEIPVGYPGFKSETFEIIKHFSGTNGFAGITAYPVGFDEKIDFSTGHAVYDKKNMKIKDIRLSLPEVKTEAGNHFLKITTDNAGYFILTFVENNSKETYTNGAAAGSDELIIPIKNGKDMSITIPSRISIREISYLKKIE